VSLFIDTSVWSLALRRGSSPDEPQVQALIDALGGSDAVIITGLVRQGLLQGFTGPKALALIVQRFSALALIQPDRGDHIAAAQLRNTCRRAGVQVGTVDALIAQLCIGNGLTLLTTDNDFMHVAKHCQLALWSSTARARRQ
jgi:predicted nucleic acid-binding protein